MSTSDSIAMLQQSNGQHVTRPLAPSDASNTQSVSSETRTEAREQTPETQLQAIDKRRRLYGRTHLANNASAVLGDIVHNNYYYGGSVPYLADLSVSRNSADISPDAISPYDARFNLWLRTQQRLDTTCQWLADTEQYQRWLNGDTNSVLICSGSVGCGKSIVAGFVVESLEFVPHAGGVVVSYFVDVSREQPTTTIEILRALIKQVLQQAELLNAMLFQRLRNIVRPIFPSSQCRPGIQELTHLVKSLIGEFPISTCVIDGIDAMAEQEIRTFLGAMAQVFPSNPDTNTRRKLALFCRPSLGRGVSMQQLSEPLYVYFGLQELEHDLQLFVNHGVDSRQQNRAITSDPKVIKAIKSTLIKHCAKMFLWIQLQLTSLWDPNIITCDEDIHRQLVTLPDGLEETYVRCLRRIGTNTELRIQEIAIRTFKWVACSRQPLTPLQAREAVSMSATNMPLTKSRLLNHPVEDYCANLVIKDELTGRIAFPHPTVKELLRNPDKLPPDLHMYLLSAEQDNLWCGEICLAYSYHLYTRSQLVRYSTQSIPHNVTASIVRDIPGGWLTSMFRHPPATVSFRIPLPSASLRRTDEVLDCTLHDYMRRHWLSHNQTITPSSPQYEMFYDLCLSFASEVLPWVARNTTEEDCFRKLIEYAVLTNHVPLLQLATEHISQSKKHLLNKVFRSSCPGTESTWLHISATLGVEQIVVLLARVCDILAVDSLGKSAAVLAIDNEHDMLIPSLLPKSLSPGLWGIGKAEHVFVIGLLRACAVKGNSFATRILLQRFGSTLPHQYLSDALLHTCKYGKLDTAKVLVGTGADPRKFDLLSGERDYYREHFSLHSLKITSRELAAQMKEDMFWDTLADLGVDLSAAKTLDDTASSFMLVKLCSRAEDADKTVYLLMSSTFVPFLQKLHGPSITWAEVLMHCMNAGYDSRHKWKQVMRAMLNKLPESISRGQIEIHERSIKDHPLIHWLHYAPDDLIIRILRLRWISVLALIAPFVIESLAQRGSSRALEAWSASMGFENVLRRSLGHRRMERDTVLLSDLLAFQQCNDSCGQSSMRNFSEVFAERFLCHMEECTMSNWKHVYSTLIRRLHADAIVVDMKQTLEYFATYELPTPSYFEQQSREEIWMQYAALTSSSSRSRPLTTSLVPSPLMWRRCVNINSHDASKAAHQCSKLLEVGATGNFSLNWPTAYTTRPSVAQVYSHGHTALRMSILLAVYGWNFKLNRRLSKPYSSADMWYMAAILREIALPRSRNHSRQLSDDIFLTPLPTIINRMEDDIVHRTLHRAGL